MTGDIVAGKFCFFEINIYHDFCTVFLELLAAVTVALENNDASAIIKKQIGIDCGLISTLSSILTGKSVLDRHRAANNREILKLSDFANSQVKLSLQCIGNLIYKCNENQVSL